MTLMDNSVDSRVADHGFDPPAAGVSSWTQDRVDLLIKLRSEGVQRGEMADRINKDTGSQFTRAAVIGKIDRVFPAAKPRKTEEEKAATIRAQRDKDNAKKREQTRAARLAAGLPVDMNRRRAAQGRVDPEPFLCQEPPDVIPLNLTLAQLEDDTCRYPYGDVPAEMVFCGNPVCTFVVLDKARKSSYCKSHHRICCRPVEPSFRPPYIGAGGRA